MSTSFTKFGFVPIINWWFYPSVAAGKKIFNERTWEGWDRSWVPIAMNQSGDAIVVKDEAIYQIQHGTGEPPELWLITKDISGLEKLVKILMGYKGFSDKDSVAVLAEKKKALQQIKKLAPKPLQDYFATEVDDIKDAIEDIKFLNTKDGRFMLAAKEFRAVVFAELRKDGKFSDIGLFRRAGKYVFFIGGKLRKGESVGDIKAVVEKYPFPFPIEYEFKPSKNKA